MYRFMWIFLQLRSKSTCQVVQMHSKPPPLNTLASFLWFCKPQITVILHTNHFKRQFTERSTANSRRHYFHFTIHFFFCTSPVDWFRFCIPLTSIGVTFITLKNQIYVPSYYIWFWKVIYTVFRSCCESGNICSTC